MHDVCSFSICCKRFNYLSNEDIVWSTLLTLHFPQIPNEHELSSLKSFYKDSFTRFNRLKRKAFAVNDKLNQISGIPINWETERLESCDELERKTQELEKRSMELWDNYVQNILDNNEVELIMMEEEPVI
ncbi:hypothetical protein AQUCO_09600006v1 [Aquilegia coerulea]|uniref:F-box domain-containing protein n=1 Tax=Aquilegia coerulea TaxID=218851 RepID=A0A2G5C4C7_AQUCA|nr:hypothetical protein AQUCO_09600006v1 [Aquilegia coerulea]